MDKRRTLEGAALGIAVVAVVGLAAWLVAVALPILFFVLFGGLGQWG